jgi:putative two-component system response regulator
VHSQNKKDRLLLVDDEDRNLRLLEAMLAPLDYEMHVAGDGLEAIGKAKEINPDLILMDAMMPRMDGFEATRKLKQEEALKDVPIIFVTALQDVSDKVRALELGADDFLRKPVEQTELRARVRSLLKVKAYNDHMRDYQQKLEREVKKKTVALQDALVRLKEASLDTILRLCRAAEFKDEQTGNHIYRVSAYAAHLGRTIGLEESLVEMILYAAPMHDIGKIGIPESILLKPGKLDAEEWETMKMHTIIGAQILEGSQADYIKTGRIIALSHHEKWDGSGYPYGLSKHSIRIEGRVTAIADVFDALTSKRPYRDPLSLEEAFSIIEAGRGSHFDPEVVDAFFKVQQDIINIKSHFRDDIQQYFAFRDGKIELNSYSSFDNTGR